MKRKILFLLLGILAPFAFVWGQTYTYVSNPAMGTYTTCSSGSFTGSTMDYYNCWYSSGSTSYENGHIKACLYSRNASNGTLVFRVKKCSGYFQNGNSGKIFVQSTYNGDIIGCSNFNITNSTTQEVSVSVYNYGNFTGSRGFRIFLITSDLVYKQYAGVIYIIGSYNDDDDCYCSSVTQLTSSSGTFTDGSGSNDYANNTHCYWVIQPANASNITLSFSSFDTEDGYDYVRVYDGGTTSSTLLGEFSGNDLPSPITSSGGRMLVEFYSDESERYGGWEASYTSQICYCSGRTTLSSPNGTIDDGSGSSNYGNNSTCEWLIQPNGASSITLTFSSFNTENSHDVVSVYNGSSTSAPLLGTFSGTSTPSPVTSTGGSMLVRFVTDGSVTRSGWSASYTSSSVSSGCTYSDCSSGNCGNNVYLTSQEVFTTAQYLCSHNIIDPGYGSNPLRPDDNISRAELAKIALYGLYDGLANVPSTLVSDYFPSVYPDLQDQSAFYYRAAKALLYLDYGDGVTPFDRNRSTFNPEGSIERCLVLKVLMETFNIAPYSGTSTSGFSDYSSTEPHWAYAKRAQQLGITTRTSFRPYDMCTRAEAFMFLYRIMTSSSITRPTPSNTSDLATSSFFIPNNLSPQTINAIRGIEYGNFQYEEKECFSNPGWIDMDFNLVYNSVMDELPDDFCPIKPLGTRVWNHTYNMYMNIIHNEYLNEDWLIFHMAGDKYLIYKSSTLEAMTDGDYNTLTRQSSTVYRLKTIDQVEYTFQKLISSQPIFYLTSICNRFGDCININYATSGNYKRITSVTSGSGSGARTYSFSYASGSDRLSSVTDPLNRTVHFYYNSDNRLSRLQDAKGNNTYYTYGLLDHEKNLLKQIQLPNGNNVYNDYQQRKLTSTQNNSNPATTINQSINYANTGDQRYTSTVTEPMTSGSSGQNLIKHYTTNERGQVVHYYDNCNVDITQYYEDADHPELPSRIVDNKLNVITSYSYSNAGLVEQKTTSASGIYFNEQYTYYSTNDIDSHTDPNGHTTHYYYTSTGALSSVTDAAGHTTSYTNNSHGRPTSIQNPQGVTTNYTYNNRGLITQISVPAASLSSSFTYDAAGRLTSNTDNNGNTTNYSYDNNDNITSITDAANHTTSMMYDANDNMTRITNARGYYTQLTYDNNDFNTSQTFQGHTKSFTYYNNGMLHTMTTPDNHTFTLTYNNSGQITNDGYASYSYASNGLLSSVSKDSKSITYNYDGIGRVTSVSYDGKTVGYSYDNNGNVLTIVYPGNRTVTYTYNNINQMTSVRDWNNHSTNYHYRNDGQLSYVQYPNNVRTTYSYDNAGRRTGQSTKRNSGSGSVIAQYTYTLDNNGNHLSEAVTEPYTTLPTVVAQTINYTYGNDNRLLTAGDKSFSYDNNGNTTAKTGRSMTYDVLNNLIGVSGNFAASYTYDGLGYRRTATRSGTTTKYVLDILQENANVLMETNSSGSVQKYYIYGADGLVSRIGSNGSTTHYYISDHRGSIVAMTDATTSANITHQYQYDEFGNLMQSQEADANPFRYVGKYGVMYEDSELYFMRARYYDPTVGRLLSEDPIWNLNLYSYADNNPISNIDPSGETWLVGGFVGGVCALPDAINLAVKSCKNAHQGFKAWSSGNLSLANYYLEIANNQIWEANKILALGMGRGALTGAFKWTDYVWECLDKGTSIYKQTGGDINATISQLATYMTSYLIANSFLGQLQMKGNYGQYFKKGRYYVGKIIDELVSNIITPKLTNSFYSEFNK